MRHDPTQAQLIDPIYEGLTGFACMSTLIEHATRHPTPHCKLLLHLSTVDKFPLCCLERPTQSHTHGT